MHKIWERVDYFSKLKKKQKKEVFLGMQLCKQKEQSQYRNCNHIKYV